VLGAEQMEMARVFGQGSSGSIDKFADYTWHTGRTGAPLLVGCRRRYECQLERSVELPAEYLGLVGRVVAAERTGKPFEPLIYHEEDY
jgi:flavin reductase (DIM6/NTAB) family NADH-FMN oxidoreductase RutF